MSRAIRPETAHELAHLLDSRNDIDEAIAVFRDLVAVRPQTIRHLKCLWGLLKRSDIPRNVAAVTEKAEASYRVLRALPRLRTAFSLPVLVSVSRKSFLRRLTGRGLEEVGAATLAAELFAAAQGADYIRTHNPGALRDGLLVRQALHGDGPADPA